MARKLFTFFLSLILIYTGCAARHQLSSIEPTDKYVNRQIEVQTKQGQKYRLVSYKITEKKIIGKDKEGKQHEELIENIKMLLLSTKCWGPLLP